MKQMKNMIKILMIENIQKFISLYNDILESFEKDNTIIPKHKKNF